jgi:hypothetical protein
MVLRLCEEIEVVCEQRLDGEKVGYNRVVWKLYKCSSCNGYHYHSIDGSATDITPIPKWVRRFVERRHPRPKG